eukprot:9653670-Ditylum_brightwellii.AAC.1
MSVNCAPFPSAPHAVVTPARFLRHRDMLQSQYAPHPPPAPDPYNTSASPLLAHMTRDTCRWSPPAPDPDHMLQSQLVSMDKILARSPLLVNLTSNICHWPPPAPDPDLMLQSQALAPDPGYTLEQPFHLLEFSVVLE